MDLLLACRASECSSCLTPVRLQVRALSSLTCVHRLACSEAPQNACSAQCLDETHHAHSNNKGDEHGCRPLPWVFSGSGDHVAVCFACAPALLGASGVRAPSAPALLMQRPRRAYRPGDQLCESVGALWVYICPRLTGGTATLNAGTRADLELTSYDAMHFNALIQIELMQPHSIFSRSHFQIVSLQRWPV